jgi:hypothetical protein
LGKIANIRNAGNNVGSRVGRVQLQIRRAFIAADGKPLQIGDLLPRCFPSAASFPRWMRNSVHRAIPKFAISLCRTNGRGRPNLYAAKPELARLINAETCSDVANVLPELSIGEKRPMKTVCNN